MCKSLPDIVLHELYDWFSGCFGDHSRFVVEVVGKAHTEASEGGKEESIPDSSGDAHEEVVGRGVFHCLEAGDCALGGMGAIGDIRLGHVLALFAVLILGDESGKGTEYLLVFSEACIFLLKFIEE